MLVPVVVVLVVVVVVGLLDTVAVVVLINRANDHYKTVYEATHAQKDIILQSTFYLKLLQRKA